MRIVTIYVGDNSLACQCEENIKKRGIFNYSFIKKLINDDAKGVKDNAYRIYQLLTLELWFREFI